MQAVVGADLGTSSAKAVAFALDGRALADAAVEVPLDAATHERAEQDVDDVVAAFARAVATVTAAVHDQGHEVVGMGLSAAMHALLAVDRQGRPLTPVLVYADRRAAAQAAAIAATAGPGLVERTGTPVHPMTPLAKLRWFAEEAPDIAARAVRWLSPKEHLVTLLTRETVVDHSIASATGMFDLGARDWDDEALALARVDRARLSTPVPTTTVLSRLDAGWSQRLGLPPDTPVCIGAADGALANLGAGAVGPGVAALTVGTSGAVRTTVDKPAGDPAGRLFCYALTEQRWVVGGPVNNGGIVLRWARDRLFPELAAAAREAREEPYAEFDDLAAGVGAGAEGLLFLPYLLGERAPLWEPAARAVFFGLSLRHGREHALRAMLEGVIYQLATVVDLLEARTGPISTVRANGGFTASPLWLQITADVLDRPVEVPPAVEGSSFGAALLAIDALGLADGAALGQRATAPRRRIEPDASAVAVHRRQLALFTQVRDALLPAFQEETGAARTE